MAEPFRNDSFINRKEHDSFSLAYFHVFIFYKPKSIICMKGVYVPKYVLYPGLTPDDSSTSAASSAQKQLKNQWVLFNDTGPPFIGNAKYTIWSQEPSNDPLGKEALWLNGGDHKLLSIKVL